MVKDALIGRVIGGHYCIESKIASGTFGRVYQARHTLIDSVVAIKILRAHHASTEERENFQREAQILSRLEHPNILQFKEFGIDGNIPYLVTTYAPQGSLRDYVEKSSLKQLPLHKVCTILSQIGPALTYAHQRQIYHRDLKPANILFNAEGKALLADFGIAVIASISNIKTGGIAGSYAYMAPEQFESKFSAKSDQYALGCITYELLTGQMPFTASSPMGWAYQHTQKEPDPGKFNPQLPSYVRLAVLKALAKKPDDRHADIEAYLTALRIPRSQETIVIISQSDVSPEEIERLLEKGGAYLREGKYQEVLDVFRQVIRLDFRSADAYYLKGAALKRLESSWEALLAYDRAGELYEMVGNNPQLTLVHIYKGDIYWSREDYEGARKEYSKAVQITPDDVLVYQKIATRFTRRKQYLDALEYLNLAIDYEPRSAALHSEKLNLLSMLGSYSEALGECDALMQISSDPTSICARKLKIALEHDFYDEAIVTYNQIIKLDPHNSHHYYGKARLLEKLDQQSVELLATYTQIIALVPADLGVRRKKRELQWHCQLYEDAFVTGNQIIGLTDALDDYRKKLDMQKALRRYNDIIDTCHQIKPECADADIYYRQAEAYEMRERAKEVDKEGLFGIVQIVKRRFTRIPQNYEHALAAYEEALRLAPADDTLYRECMGDLLKRLGKRNQAEKIKRGNQSQLPWLLSFLLAPLVTNSLLIITILALRNLLANFWWFAGSALCLSAFVTLREYLRNKRSLPYHLYNASLLCIPIFGFTIECLMVSFLFPLLGISAVLAILLFLLVFLINSALYFCLDIWEEQVVIQVVSLVGIGIMWAWNELRETISARIKEVQEERNRARVADELHKQEEAEKERVRARVARSSLDSKRKRR